VGGEEFVNVGTQQAPTASRRVVGYSVATVLVAVATVALTWATDPTTAWITALALFAVVVVQVVFGRWLAARQASLAVAMGFIGFIAVLMGLACFGGPEAAMFQFIAHPLVWTYSRSFRQAVFNSTLLTVGVGVGSAFTTGWAVAAGMAALSLAFSIAIGSWLSHWIKLARQRAELIAELRATQESAQELEYQAGKQAERARLAREIHDTITQNLTGIVLATQRVRRGGSDVDIAEQFAVIEELAASALTEARSLVSGQPSAAAADLVASVQRLGVSFQRETSVVVSVHAELAEPLDTETGVVLLRCVQESLANVRNHAQAHHVSISLDSDAACVTLVVADDGIGLAAAGEPNSGHGHGIANMTERVGLAGGTFAVTETAPGTVVRVSLPIGERHSVSAG
jgi:signal transduction histidine kinase